MFWPHGSLYQLREYKLKNPEALEINNNILNEMCGLHLPREPYRSTRLLQLTD